MKYRFCHTTRIIKRYLQYKIRLSAKPKVDMIKHIESTANEVLIQSKTATTILNATRQDLVTLVRFGVLHPLRVNTRFYLYNLDEINELLKVKNSVNLNSGLCKK